MDMNKGKWTTIILHEDTLIRLTDIARQLEERYRVRISMERTIIELIDEYLRTHPVDIEVAQQT
jgi:hypothetical protein